MHVHVEGASGAPADVLKSLEKDFSFFGAQCKEWVCGKRGCEKWGWMWRRLSV